MIRDTVYSKKTTRATAITVENSFMQPATSPRAFFVPLLNWRKQVKETLQESNNDAIRDIRSSLLTILSTIRPASSPSSRETYIFVLAIIVLATLRHSRTDTYTERA